MKENQKDQKQAIPSSQQENRTFPLDRSTPKKEGDPSEKNITADKNTEETIQEQNAKNSMDEKKHLDRNQATNQDLRPIEERTVDLKKDGN